MLLKSKIVVQLAATRAHRTFKDSVSRKGTARPRPKKGLATTLDTMPAGGNDIEINEHINSAVFPSSEQHTPNAPWLFDMAEFLKHFARITVVHNSAFARFGRSNWAQEALKHVVIGNSRKAPTHSNFKCFSHVFDNFHRCC